MILSAMTQGTWYSSRWPTCWAISFAPLIYAAACGEEFAIILPDSSAQDASIRADALRSEIKHLQLQYRKQTLGPISLSAGIAAFPENGLTSDELLRIADQ